MNRFRLTAARQIAWSVFGSLYRSAPGKSAVALLGAVCAISVATAQPEQGQIEKAVKAVDSAAIAGAADSGNWLSYGLTRANQRYSKLEQIKTDNVKDLGLVWTYDLETQRGVESTPIVVDGVMYVTTPWSNVYALDAETGERIWRFDSMVPRRGAYKACCDVGNRGVAIYKGRVYVGTLDGRLIALDAVTGNKVWEADTIIDHSRSYTVTGAPIIADGKVVIGNGGAEYGVRGYVTAYDWKTGEQAWRWYTVPGDPSKPYENEAMKMAAKTWDPSGEYWKAGGGGTVWNSMSYDPELDQLYIGVGNGSPWNQKVRSPAGGDNLFLASIVALDPSTGEYIWHYQETPGENSDYTSTQDLIQADLKIDGTMRKVLMQAPKNGFFFVVDRTDGEFISANNFVDVNWAKGYDDNGRPIETDLARPDDPFDSIPGPFGGHNWQSMSYSPQAGLAYIPSQHIPIELKSNLDWEFHLKGTTGSGEPMSNTGWNLGFFGNDPMPKSQIMGRLIAWDPIKQQEAWHHDYGVPWNGGTLATAGNLVFHATADGHLIAFDARTGEQLWQSPVGEGAIAAPVTYTVDGRQYVSIAVGWGGVAGLMFEFSGHQGSGRVFTFALGGDAKLPEFAPYHREPLLSGVAYDKADVEEGARLYVESCSFCHGVPAVQKGGTIPNLGYVGPGPIENLDKYVLGGALADQGMPNFTGRLSEEDVTKIQAFIQATADSVRQAQAGSE